ncbi:family 16 glycosylhydrolase [Arthrobacter zhaoguopingii]|uniref:family 16 glycosylhydrolase n=1 Tax=Arthrobacter zhaoguopingii TaxID=2681491 RepID=UPI001357A566|nr:family 16 glycosylhydrolase [Arthrobacter zhaoguopingii]
MKHPQKSLIAMAAAALLLLVGLGPAYAGGGPTYLRQDYAASSSTSIRAVWNPVPGYSGVYKHYLDGRFVAGASDPTTGETFSGLASGSIHTVQVSAVISGVEYKSAVVTMKATRTPPITPAPPTNLRPVASGTTQTAIRVEWDAPAGYTGGYKHYVNGVHVAGQDDATKGETLTGLAPNTSYNIQVSATIGGIQKKSAVLTAKTNAVPPAPSAWKLSWADEFNGAAVDTTKWNVLDNSTYGDGNDELACLQNENVSVTNGKLTITAQKLPAPVLCNSNDGRFPGGRLYTSGHLNTLGKFETTHGRLEMSAKLPVQQGTSKGLWPAFWMRPVDRGVGEIDIMEALGSSRSESHVRANEVHQTIHYDYDHATPHGMQDYEYILPNGRTMADGFHQYAVEWEPGVIRWYVDGVKTYERNRTTTSWMDESFSRNFFLRLNLAIGGSWPGSPDADTQFPALMEVDYVRAYKR